MYRVLAIAILSLLLCGSIGTGVWLYKKWKDTEEEKESVIKLNGNATKELQYYKNQNGHLVAQNQSISLESKTIKELHSEGQLQILNEFNGLKKNYKNLIGLMQSDVKAGNVLSLPVKDSGSFAFKDEWQTLTGHLIKGDTSLHTGFLIPPKGTSFDCSPGNLTVQLYDSVRVPLAVVVYWHRTWLFGKKNYRAEAVSLNPHAKITGLENILLKKE